MCILKNTIQSPLIFNYQLINPLKKGNLLKKLE